MIHSLLFVLPLAQSGIGASFVALPGAPAMYESSGRVVDARKVLLRELVFLGRDRAGIHRFRLPDRRIVTTKVGDPFRTLALAPLTETKGLRELRRRYVGRRVWVYGTIPAGREAPPFRRSYTVYLPPGRSARIARILRLAVPQGSPVVKESAGLVTGSSTTSVDGPFLVVLEPSGVRLPPLQDDRWSAAQNRHARNPRIYGPPYQIIDQGWLLDRMYSLTPPPASARRAIKKVADAGKQGSLEEALLGFSHLQTAWAYGWPKEPVPLSRLLREPRWTYNDIVLIDFKGGRVASFRHRIPH
jgi:hypothetical protein